MPNNFKNLESVIRLRFAFDNNYEADDYYDYYDNYDNYYEDNYSIQDEENEYNKLQTAKSAATSPEALALIDQKLMELINDNLSIEDGADNSIHEFKKTEEVQKG